MKIKDTQGLFEIYEHVKVFFWILFSFAIISSGFLFILSRSIILDSKNTNTSAFEVEKWSFSWIINGTLLFDQKQNRFSILNKLWLWISISFEVPFAVFNKTTASEFLILKVKCGINNSKYKMITPKARIVIMSYCIGLYMLV